MEGRESWQAWTTGERKARSHSSIVIPNQGPVSHAQYDTRDTYVWRTYKQYGHNNQGSINAMDLKIVYYAIVSPPKKAS